MKKGYRAEIGDLVEVRSGRYAQTLGRVVWIHNTRVDLMRVAIDEDYYIRELGLIHNVPRRGLLWMPWPDELQKRVAQLNKQFLRRVKDGTGPREQRPPNIRSYSWEDLGLSGEKAIFDWF